MPAWLAADSAGSRKLTSANDFPGGQRAVRARRWAGVWLAASWRAWPRVSRTKRVGQAQAERNVGGGEQERRGSQPVAGREGSRWPWR